MAGKISTLIFQVASFVACLFVFSFLTVNSSYALSSSCKSLGGALTYSSCDAGQKPVSASDANGYMQCCAPNPRTVCENAGGEYYNSYQNRVPNASYEQFPNLYPGHCFKVRSGCSNNGTPQSAGCVCSANTSIGLLNACKSNLGCKAMSDGVQDTNGNRVVITGHEVVYVAGMDRKRSSYVARIYANSNTNTYITKNVRNVEGICTVFPSGSPASGISGNSAKRGVGASCAVNGVRGTCQNNPNMQTTCLGGAGKYYRGYCPGDKYVQCCVPNVKKTYTNVLPVKNIKKDENVGKSCYVPDKGNGTCQNTNVPGSCSGGSWNRGHCPGGNNIVCCVKNSPRYQ